jgi:hypothetical protein
LLLGCLALLFMHWVAGGLACSTDTSNCTDSHVKGVTYRGTLVDRQGRALTDTPFTVESGSGVPSRDLGAFTTDRAGNYCIVTAASVRPVLYVAGNPSASDIGSPTPLDGSGAPPGCQEGGVPYNAFNGPSDTPEYDWVFILGVCAIGLLWFGLYYRESRFCTVGAGMSAATLALAIVVWFA